MKKLKPKQIKKYLEILNRAKILAGLSDYKIFIVEEIKGMDSIARIYPDIYEKSLEVEISEEFLNKEYKQQMNILLHELVHGRVLIMKQKINEYVEIEEEHMVNDIVRGFELITDYIK